MDVETTLGNVSLTVAIAGGILVVLLLLAALLFAKRPRWKAPIFASIVAVVIATILTIAGSTIYLNFASATGGPVHWHTDFEIWACGNELALRDPTGLSNKIGTPSLHEHNDKRIHLEGVPVTLPHDFSLGTFMQAVGGGLSSTSLTVPLNSDNYFETGPGREDGDGNGAPAPDLVQPFIHTTNDGSVATFVSGQKCGDQTAEVQAFAYHYNMVDNTYTQQKLADPATFAGAHEENVPPGDCVIIEFSPHKDRTDKLCQQYGVRDALRCGDFGVPADQREKTCVAREVQR